MIRVKKSQNPPAILRKRGQRETQSIKILYERDPTSFMDGTRKFDFDSGLYGAKSVKNALIRAQHGKCCFCESKITHISYGDVEHFRPKGGYRQYPSDSLRRPGYYWLAYDWGNLYLACAMCNQRFKRNTFPLMDPDQRARNHHADLSREAPVFIDPGGTEDPEELIAYEAEQPRGQDERGQGETTIQALALRREDLRERRLDRYRMLSALQRIARLLPDDDEGREAQAILKDAVKDTAEYASMARSLLGS